MGDLKITAWEPHQVEVRTEDNKTFEIDCVSDGAVELYIDEARSTYERPNAGCASMTIKPENVPDFIVALQAWIETI